MTALLSFNAASRAPGPGDVSGGVRPLGEGVGCLGPGVRTVHLRVTARTHTRTLAYRYGAKALAAFDCAWGLGWIGVAGYLPWEQGSLLALMACFAPPHPHTHTPSEPCTRYIATHTAELAQAVVDAGAVPLLVLCIQEPEISLKRITASALNDIAKHSPEVSPSPIHSRALSLCLPRLRTDHVRGWACTLFARACIARGGTGLRVLPHPLHSIATPCPSTTPSLPSPV